MVLQRNRVGQDCKFFRLGFKQQIFVFIIEGIDGIFTCLEVLYFELPFLVRAREIHGLVFENIKRVFLINCDCVFLCGQSFHELHHVAAHLHGVNLRAGAESEVVIFHRISFVQILQRLAEGNAIGGAILQFFFKSYNHQIFLGDYVHLFDVGRDNDFLFGIFKFHPFIKLQHDLGGFVIFFLLLRDRADECWWNGILWPACG